MAESPTSYKLTDLVYQQQDATIFNGAAIPAVAGSAEAFIIFYLSREDEQNGYGTVIQLDSQTKQAAIFADLNPEYSYLFYKDEQGVLQSLLWCIEFATRTPDGLFVTQAKVYGRGINEQELRQLAQQQAQPSQPYSLTDPVSPSIQAPPTDPTPTNPINEAAPAAPASEMVTEPTPQAATPSAQPDLLAMDQPTAAPSATEPDLSLPSLDALPQAPAMPTDWQTPSPSAPAEFDNQSAAASSPAPVGTSVPIPATDSTPAPQADLFWPEPPAPASSPVQTSPMPAAPLAAPTPQPQAIDLQTTAPSAPLSSAPAPMAAPPAQPTTVLPPAEPKQPVGRPPKPLIQDRLWMISAEDFTWLKTISREPIEANKELLRQKIINQIRANQPGLIEDWQFLGRFEQAFAAICLTYNLVPGLRHDLLKSLLNGRVIDGVMKQS